jgi:uncharacterized protein YqjF (DUF2071 family)
MPAIDVFPPRAVSHPLMFQTWETLTFIHWPYDREYLQGLLPHGLELDTFDGQAWIGLVPFKVVHLHPPGLPSLPWISHFPETNVRTYVRGPDGERGIWFFTLEADRLFAVVGARLSYGLPYRWAKMRLENSGDRVTYSSRRKTPLRPAHSEIDVGINGPATAGELESFLTARFRLYATMLGQLVFADVQHEPWPLYRATILSLDQNLIEACELPRETGEPLVHYSPGVHVRVGRPKLAGNH